MKLFQVVYSILAGGASASTFFVRRRHGAVQLSPVLSDSPVKHTFFFLDFLIDDGGAIPTFDEKDSFFGECCLKKNQNAPRPSEHPPLRGKNVKTFRWDHRLQIQNLFMAFKWIPI